MDSFKKHHGHKRHGHGHGNHHNHHKKQFADYQMILDPVQQVQGQVQVQTQNNINPMYLDEKPIPTTIFEEQKNSFNNHSRHGGFNHNRRDRKEFKDFKDKGRFGGRDKHHHGSHGSGFKKHHNHNYNHNQEEQWIFKEQILTVNIFPLFLN